MENLQIRIEQQLKDDAQQIAQQLGMDLSTAVKIFLTQMVNDHGLPFKPSLDPFYSEKNQARLAQSLAELNNGK